MSKNIEMNYKTESGSYEVLYPRTLTANVTDLNSYYYTKSQINSTFPTFTYLNQNYYTQSQTNSQIDNKIESYGDSIIEPVGTIKCTSRTDLGNDWLLCNGQSFSATDYPALASLLPASATSAWQLVGSDKCPVEGKVFKAGDYYCKAEQGSNGNVTLYYTTTYSANQNINWSSTIIASDYSAILVDIEDICYIPEVDKYIVISCSTGGLSGRYAIDVFVSSGNGLRNTWSAKTYGLTDMQTGLQAIFYVGCIYIDNRFYAYWKSNSLFGICLEVYFVSNSYRSSSVYQIHARQGSYASTGTEACQPLIIKDNILLCECNFDRVYDNNTIAYTTLPDFVFTQLSSSYYSSGYESNRLGWSGESLDIGFIYLDSADYNDSQYMDKFDFDSKQFQEGSINKTYYPKFLFGTSNSIIKSGNLNYFLRGDNNRVGAVNDSDLQNGDLGTTTSTTVLDSLIIGSDNALYGINGNNLYALPGGVVPNISGGTNYKYYIKGR